MSFCPLISRSQDRSLGIHPSYVLVVEGISIEENILNYTTNV